MPRNRALMACCIWQCYPLEFMCWNLGMRKERDELSSCDSCQWKLSLMSSAAATNISLNSAKVLGCPHHSFCVFTAAQVVILSINLQRDIFQNLFAWLFMSILYFNEKTTSVFVLKWFPNETNAFLHALRKLLIHKCFEFTKTRRSCVISSNTTCNSRYLKTFWYFSIGFLSKYF